MENRYFSNNATTTVSSLSGTTLVVASAAKFPSQYPYFLTLETAGLTREIVKVTASPSANTLTIVRAQEGTIQSTFASGDKAELRVTAGTLNSLVTDKADLSGATFTGTTRVTTGSNGKTSLYPGSVQTFTNSGTSVTETTLGSVGIDAISGVTQTSITAVNETGTGGSYTPAGQYTTITNTSTSEKSSIILSTVSSVDTTKLTLSTEGGYSNLLMTSTAIPSANSGFIRRFGYGSPLPSTDIGMIWHDDYWDFMIWRTFAFGTENEYNGYASMSIGTFKMDTASRIGDGYLSQGYNVSKTTYAALWAWANDIGITVDNAAYSQGNFHFADVGFGIFKLPNLGGYFPRIHDSMGIRDTGRSVLSSQSHQMSSHSHWIYGQDNSAAPSGYSSNEIGNVESSNSAQALFMRTTGSTGGTHNNSETRPYNTSFLGRIKF